MEAYLFIDVIQDSAYTILKMSTPIMLIGLAVGVIISFLQALTQIQETTLTFVPKIIVMLVAITLLFPYMISGMVSFAQKTYSRIVR